MAEKDINSYRLTSLKEPTDEMLSQIMKEAAADANAKSEAAHKKFFDEIQQQMKHKELLWSNQNAFIISED